MRYISATDEKNFKEMASTLTASSYCHNIIVADTFEPVNFAVSYSLRQRGFNVTSISTGSELLSHFVGLYTKYAETGHVELPVLITEHCTHDLLSGLYISSDIKELFPEIIVIILTTNDSVKDHPLAPIANAVLMKPMEASQLEFEITRLLCKA